MATIHPSRMNLIQPSLRETRRPSPPRDERRRDQRRSRSRSRERRSRSRDRRRSPDYGDYKRSKPSEDSYAREPRGGAGNSWLEQRRKQRENLTANPWPPSPKAVTRELSPRRSRHSKRDRSSSLSSSDSSDEDRRRKRRKKDKKRSKKDKHRRSRSQSYDREPREKEKRSTSRRVSAEPMDADQWVEKSSTPSAQTSTAIPPSTRHPSSPPPDSDSDDDGIGPMPAAPSKSQKIDERSYGGSLLRGEGSAMAAFLQGEDGTQARIPRRGEIGLDSGIIAKYEDVGYVMSGSRHHRMNAVRMRKENQVISAEEKRQMLTLQKEERERKEAILREEFNELVHEKLKKVGVGPDPQENKGV